MTVATFAQPNATNQTPAEHGADVDACIQVNSRIAGAFAAHEATTPALTVVVDAGMCFSSPTLTEVAQQTVSGFTAPSAGSERIDRIVIDDETGVATRVAGTESAGSPSSGAPAIPAGKLPVCQIRINYTDTVITNSMITDERVGIPGSLLEERGTWTAVATFATPQDLSVAYSTRVATYTKIGRLVSYFCVLVLSTFTYGSPTPTGNFQITGLPYAALNLANHSYTGMIRMGGWTKTNYTQTSVRLLTATSIITVGVTGSGQAPSTLTASEMASGGSVNILASGSYEADG